MNITAEQVVTVVVAIITSSVISVIVSAIVNRSKLTAEVQKLHSQAATDTINNYRYLVADQKTHIEGLKLSEEVAKHSIALLPTLTRRNEELEAELKRERGQSAALRALLGQGNDPDPGNRTITA